MDGLLEGLEFHHVKDWSKDFLVDYWGVRGDCNDCWQHVVALHCRDCLATVQDLSTLGFDCGDAFQVLLDCSLCMKRAKQSVVIHWMSNSSRDLWVGLHKSLHKSIMNAFVEIEPSQGCAPLASCSDSAEDSAGEGELKITVWHNDVCVISSKLQDCSSKSCMDLLADSSAHSG